MKSGSPLWEFLWGEKKMVANLLVHLDFWIESFFRQGRMGTQKAYDVRFQFGPGHNGYIIFVQWGLRFIASASFNCKRMATYS